MSRFETSEKQSGGLLRMLLPVILILAGLAGGIYFKSREPEIKRKPPVKQAAVVETIRLDPRDYSGSIRVMGTVAPDKKVVLKARVSGEVVSVAPALKVGGRVKKGELLVILDDADYAIEVEKAVSALEKARADYDLEQGSQQIARAELELINKASAQTIEATDLALRKPQLRQARAAIKGSEASLEKARLNLSRTKIRVPFNALVMEKNIETGSLVTSQEPLCTLVGLDYFQVEAQVAPDLLGAFSIDETRGSKTIVHSRYSNQTWPGQVVRTTGQMTGKSRMAGVIIQVADPLGIAAESGKASGVPVSPLLLGDHVDVSITGRQFKKVYALPRNLLRENQNVWVFNEGKLDIRKVEIIWKEDSRVFVSSGINPGDQVVVSDLPAPVRGMALQRAEDVKQKEPDPAAKQQPGSGMTRKKADEQS